MKARRFTLLSGKLIVTHDAFVQLEFHNVQERDAVTSRDSHVPP